MSPFKVFAGTEECVKIVNLEPALSQGSLWQLQTNMCNVQVGSVVAWELAKDLIGVTVISPGQ